MRLLDDCQNPAHLTSHRHDILLHSSTFLLNIFDRCAPFGGTVPGAYSTCLELSHRHACDESSTHDTVEKTAIDVCVPVSKTDI